MAPELTPAGKKNMLCQGINVGHVYNRGLPRDLVDLEGNMKGQNRNLQPFCATEGEDIQFSVFDRAMPRAAFGPMPTPPVSVIQTRDVTENRSCYHGAGNCGAECPHTAVCPCKDAWQSMNKAPQPMPPAPMCVQSTSKLY